MALNAIKQVQSVFNFTTYFSSLRDTVRILSYISLTSVTNAVLVFSLPSICFYFPLSTPLFISIPCTGLAFSIFRQAWNQAAKVSQEAEKIKQLEEQNASLSSIKTDFMAISQRLEAAMNLCLGRPAQINAFLELDNQTHVELLALSEQVQILAELCEVAGSNEAMLNRLRGVQSLNEQLSKLQQECAERGMELKRLNGELSNTHRQFNDSLQEFAQTGELWKKGEQELEKLLSEFKNKE